MDRALIESRILYWRARKARLLKLKKEKRGSGLQEADNILSRLIRWKNELSINI